MNSVRSFDVIVVGGGGSGLATAVSCAEGGLHTLLLEKLSKLGGTTGIAVGSFTSNGTRFQESAGIRDHALDHTHDVGLFAKPEIERRNHQELRSFFLQRSSEAIHWLADMGISFHGPVPEPPNRVPRMHNVVPSSKAYIDTLTEKFRALGGKIRLDSPVSELIQENGRITGIKIHPKGNKNEESFHASRGVVLAAGDYANGRDLLSKHKGPEFGEIEGINPHATGDGQKLVGSVGGKLLNMDVTYGPELRFVHHGHKSFLQYLPSTGVGAKLVARFIPWVPKSIFNAIVRRQVVTWQHPENSLFDQGAILINSSADRYCNEKKAPERETSTARQTDKKAYILLDNRLIQHYSQWPHFISTAPRIAYAYVKDYLQLRPDVSISAKNLESLASKRGLPVNRLLNTVQRFNDYCENRKEDPFGRKDDTHPLKEGPWVLLGPVKAYFTTTEGGAAINQDFEVLNEQGSIIPGLYAVGQNGLGGQVLWGHGLHIAWAMTSGYLLGRKLGGLST